MVLGDPGRVRERARSDGTARRRRGASSAVLGVRARGDAAWRGREASRRSQGRGTGRARRVAGGLNSTATSARQKTGEGRENRERIRGLIQIQIFLINSF